MLTFRVLLVVVCGIAVLPPATSQTVLATAASTLFEGTPFILAGAAAQALWPRWGARMVPYLGCGCGPGPSARSLPAAAATWLVFGPVVAGARLGAAIVVKRLLRRGPACADVDPLAQLQSLAFVAVCNGVLLTFAMPVLQRMHVHGAVAFAFGAASAFVASPCALGAASFAGMLHSAMPLAGVGFLCVAGIADLKTFLRHPEPRAQHACRRAEPCGTHASKQLCCPEPCGTHVSKDAWHGTDFIACITLALACAIVASRNGASLVHPHFALPLFACAIAAIVIAFKYRSATNTRQRIVPTIMLAGSLIGAPLPSYPAMVTTLADAYAGQSIAFTGVSNGQAVTRYAITCCRADAAPVTVRLSHAIITRGWVRARGTIVTDNRGLALNVTRIESIAAPSDPFLYR